MAKSKAKLADKMALCEAIVVLAIYSGVDDRDAQQAIAAAADAFRRVCKDLPLPPPEPRLRLVPPLPSVD